MPAPVYSAALWEQVKPIIHQKYLVKEETAKMCRQYLRDHHNMDVTQRKLKSMFSEWNWPKKIKESQYGAMEAIMVEFGQVDFWRSTKGGTDFVRIDAAKAIKENKRKKTTKAKKHQPPMAIPDLETAYAILRDGGITWEQPDTSQSRPHAAGNSARRPSNRSARANFISQEPIEIPDDEDSDSTSSHESAQQSPNLVVDSSRRLNLQNFGLRQPPTNKYHDNCTLPSSAQPILPFQAAWLADLHANIFPQQHEYRLGCAGVSIADEDEVFRLASVDSSFVSWDFSDFFAAIDPDALNSHLTLQEKFIAVALQEHYRKYDQAGHRREVLTLSNYWIGQLLAGIETPDDYDHPSRQRARLSLKLMLDRQNMELLPACYWVTSVIMSFDRSRLLLAFFEDCIDCMETNSSFLATLLQPWIRFMVIFHSPSYQNYEARSPRLRKDVIETMRRSFDASSELQRSIEMLRQTGCLDSATGLILCIYRAWHIAAKDPYAGIKEMSDCLERSEKSFGLTHLVTIQCASMLADGYQRLQHWNALNYYETVLIRLRPCSRMLEPIFYRSMFRRARLLIEQGELRMAQGDLETIFEFHLRTFGAQSPLTWEAAEELFPVLERQGFVDEARRKRAEFEELYERQWKNRPIRL